MMTRRKPMDSWEKVLRGRVMPDTTNQDEMTAFFLRKAMIRRQIEDDIQAIDTTTAFNNLMSAIENMEKTR
jgi:hypothetical protein